MSFELKQLKSILALEAGGNMRKAAYQLCLSQSALSHQFRELEHRVGGELFIRNSVPLIFTQKGQVLLSLAKKILPQVSKAHQQLMQKNMTHHNIVIDIQCHACFQWLLPIIQKTSNTFPFYEFEFEFEFGNSSFLSNHQSQAGLLFSDDENNNTYNATQKIGSVELLAILPKHHALTQRKFIDAEDFALQTLLTYPVEKDRLDIFNLLLRPKHVQPAQIKQVDNSHVILQMVAANMGIAILPNWLVTSMAGSIVSRR